MPATSPGSLASNPPPRWGAPGDDLVGDPVGVGKRGIPGNVPEVLWPRETPPCRSPATTPPDVPPPSPAASRAGCRAAPASHRRAPRCRAGCRHSASATAPAATCLPVVRPDLVPTLSGDLVDYANLDHAASTPAFERVARAVEAATRTYSRSTAAPGWLSRITSAHYEAARDEVARFVGARQDDVVVFTRNTTDSVNLLARALPRDTSVVVFASEHHATLLPWRGRDTVRLPVPGSARDAEVLLEDALRALPRRHRPPPAPGARRAHRRVERHRRALAGRAPRRRRPPARGAGAAGCRPVRRPPDRRPRRARRRLGRILRPQGARPVRHRCARRSQRLARRRPALPRRRRRHRRRSPSAAPAGPRGPARHEAGSPNVLGAVALAAACATIREHRAAIEQHEARLTARLARRPARPSTASRPTPSSATTHDRGPVVTFTVDGLDSHLVAAALSAEHGIGVRAGKFCAHLLVDALLEEGSTTSTPPRCGSAPAWRRTEEHVERLLAAVAVLAADGPGADYVRDPRAGLGPVDDTARAGRAAALVRHGTGQSAGG